MPNMWKPNVRVGSAEYEWQYWEVPYKNWNICFKLLSKLSLSDPSKGDGISWAILFSSARIDDWQSEGQQMCWSQLVKVRAIIFDPFCLVKRVQIGMCLFRKFIGGTQLRKNTVNWRKRSYTIVLGSITRLWLLKWDKYNISKLRMFDTKSYGNGELERHAWMPTEDYESRVTSVPSDHMLSSVVLGHITRGASSGHNACLDKIQFIRICIILIFFPFKNEFVV